MLLMLAWLLSLYTHVSTSQLFPLCNGIAMSHITCILNSNLPFYTRETQLGHQIPLCYSGCVILDIATTLHTFTNTLFSFFFLLLLVLSLSLFSHQPVSYTHLTL